MKKFELRPYQKEAVEAGVRYLTGRSKKPGVIVAPTGCHAAGSLIRMADGSAKRVESIEIGDKVMGIDGKPRYILELHKGIGDMYRITPDADSPGFVVNGGHILPVYTENGNMEVVVEDYFRNRNSFPELMLRNVLVLKSDSKLAEPGYKVINESHCGFRVSYEGVDMYYGFTTDGDHLYIDTNGFAHHNSGKSLIIGSVVKGINAPTLVLQPSKEILMQNYEKAVSFGLEPTIYSASCRKKEISELTYATIGSVKKEVDTLKQIGIKYILLDEVHYKFSPEPDSEFMKFIVNFENIKMLGFTATPCRLHSYSSMAEGNYSMLNMLTKDTPRFIENMVHVIQIQDMVKGGYWSRINYEVWEFDDKDLILNSTGSDYTEDSIKRSIAKNGVNNTIYRRIMSLWNERKHILVCMDSVENSYILSNFMNRKMGSVVSAVVEGSTPKKKREAILEDFRNGKIKVVINYSTLTIGFDFPELDCVIFGRPTFSYAIYYQVVGRLVRPHKEKDSALFVDCCNNYGRFGRVEDLTIEQFPGNGWSMFVGDKLISNVPMGSDITKQYLWERYQKELKMEEIKAKCDEVVMSGNYVMSIGMYRGKKLKEVPTSYLKWYIENVDRKQETERLKAYYRARVLS